MRNKDASSRIRLKVHFELWLPNHLQVEEFLGWREHTVRADEEAGAEAAVLWLRV